MPRKPLAVDLFVTFVPLPNQAAVDRWYEGWALLLKMDQECTDRERLAVPAQAVAAETGES